MDLKNWIIPVFLGLILVWFLMGILYPEMIGLKQKFSDLGALIQLQTSRPVYYPAYIMSNSNPNVNYSSPNSDLLVSYPVYNYYPQTPLNPTPTNTLDNKKIPNENIYVNKPDIGYNAHLLSYYGEYPYPLPMIIYPPTNIDNVKGVEDKI